MLNSYLIKFFLFYKILQLQGVHGCQPNVEKAAESPSFAFDPVVDTPLGKIEGSWGLSENGNRFKKFRGLQFGDIVDRFQEASLVESLANEENTFLAKSNGPCCPQQSWLVHTDEQCLYLNVFTPEQGTNKSVMVWVHGGSLTSGCGAEYEVNPSMFMDRDVIIVSINYRLNVFGFLSLENPLMPGNQGLKDQLLALKWVRNNIESFGGNPNDVTIFGESAGSRSIAFDMVSPLSQGLFHKVIGQSGNCFDPRYQVSRPGRYRRVTYDIASALDCNLDSDETVQECLSTVDTDLLLDTAQNTAYTHFDWPWVPNVDSYMEHPFLPELPDTLLRKGEYTKVPMIFGVNSEEGILYTAPFIKDNSKFNELNENWDYFGPRKIFDTDAASPEEVELARNVRNFYLGDKVASMETYHEVIDMMTDINYWSGAHRFSLEASGQIPIYKYLLTYRSGNTYSRIGLGLDPDSLGLGVCHVDDLYHMFKYAFVFQFTEEDLRVRDLFLTWWTDFAKTGKPTMDDSWSSFNASSPQYMQIKPYPEMVSDSRYAERMEFWMEIIEQYKEINTNN